MSNGPAFYRQQAEACAASAAKASLANERDKFLQAEAAWQGLADAQAKVAAEAARRVAEKAEAEVEADLAD